MQIGNEQAIGLVCLLNGGRAGEASAMFLPPQDGFTCTKSVAECLIILCSRKVFGCGGGSWFKPKVKIFLLNWNKQINVTSAVSLRNKVSELPGLHAGKICGGDRLETPPKCP